MRRGKAIFVTLMGIFLLGNVPSILGDNLWKDFTIFGKSIFDAFDFVSGNISLYADRTWLCHFRWFRVKR